MTADEHPKPQVTIEALAKLPPVFKKGESRHYIVPKLFIQQVIVQIQNKSILNHQKQGILL